MPKVSGIGRWNVIQAVKNLRLVKLLGESAKKQNDSNPDLKPLHIFLVLFTMLGLFYSNITRSVFNF